MRKRPRADGEKRIGGSESLPGTGGCASRLHGEAVQQRVPEPERQKREKGGRGHPLYEIDVVDLNLYLSFRFPVNFHVAPWMTSFLLLVCDPNRSENAS